MWLRSYTLAMPRERFQNNLRLVLAVTGGLLLLFLLAELLLRKSRDFQPDFLASALLYALTVLNISLLLVLLFVLGRNLVRMLMEWRRGVFGARLRVQLLLVFLTMAIAPSLLILLVGSDLIRQTVDRWFNVDVERMLAASQTLGMAVEERALETSRVQARLLAGGPPLLNEAMPEFERTLLREALKVTRGGRQDAARLLGWGRNTLTRKLKELGMEDL